MVDEGNARRGVGALDVLSAFGPDPAGLVLDPGGVLEICGDLDRLRRWRSVTKPVTGLALTLAAQDGLLDLDAEAGPPGATVRHLLAHAAGCFYESAEVLHPPGVRRAYSNFGIDEAGRAFERITGRELAAFVHERIARPLGMSTLQWTGSPSVGAHGSLRDLAALAREVLTPTLLDPAWHAEMTRAQFPDLVGVMPGFGAQHPNPFGLAIEVRGHKSPHWTGTRNSPGTVGHFGMRGCAFWVDPEARIALVVATDLDFCDVHRRMMSVLGDAVLDRYTRR